MKAPPWMLVRLALETCTYHTQADEDRLALLDVQNIAQYRALLTRIYGFEAPVEAAIARVDESLLRSREKAPLLRNDLQALGTSVEEIGRLPTCGHVAIRSVPQAVGWLFVIERHTLLAGILRRHVVKAVGPEVKPAIGYLSAYGDSPGARLRALGDMLGTFARRYSVASICAAANEAFRAQRQWYLAHPMQPARAVA